MNSSVISVIYNILSTDEQLQVLAPGGVHTMWTMDGILPRVILTFSFGRTDNSKIRGGSLSVDIFYASNAVELCEHVKDRIIEILEGKVIDSDESDNTLRLYLFSDAQIRETDDKILHWSMIFNMRFYRKKALQGV